MIHSTLRRRITQGGLPWRSLQQLIRSSPLRETQMLQSRSSATLICRQSSSNRFLSVRPIACLASRLCHGNPPGGPDAKGSVFSMNALPYAPLASLYLGLNSLFPFFTAPIFMATGSCWPILAYVHVLYTASVLSFLGAARWRYLVREGRPGSTDNLRNGAVFPSLVAWLPLLSGVGVMEGGLLVLLGLGLSMHYDLTLLPRYPAWFKALRTLQTLLASISLVAVLALHAFCVEEENDKEPQRTWG